MALTQFEVGEDELPGVLTGTTEYTPETGLESVIPICLYEAWEAESAIRDASASSIVVVEDATNKWHTFHEALALRLVADPGARPTKRYLAPRLASASADTRYMLSRTRLAAADNLVMSDARDYMKAESVDPGDAQDDVTEVARQIRQIYLTTVDNIFDAVSEPYEHYYQHRRTGLGMLYDFLSQNTSEIEGFVNWVERNSLEADPAIEPLLILLANDINDTEADNHARDLWYKLRSEEVILDMRREYVEECLRQIDAGDVQPNTGAEFLQLVYSMTEVNGSDFMQSVIDHFGKWPQVVTEEYKRFYKQVLDLAEQRVAVALKEKVRRGRFEPPVTGLGASSAPARAEKGGRKKRNQNGRVTPKLTVINSPAETEPQPIFDGWARVRKTPAGYIVDECERQSIIELLQDATRRYGSGPDFLDGLVGMLDSIYKQPFGWGANQMHSRSLTIDHRNYPVWHLNPHNRPGLVLTNDDAARMRIYYVAPKLGQESVRRVLGVVAAGHHNHMDNDELK